MTSDTFATPNRSLPDFRKDTTMYAIELRLAEARERQALLRSIREAERSANRSAGSLRLRLGASIIAIGRRVGGEAATSPAWQG